MTQDAESVAALALAAWRQTFNEFGEEGPSSVDWNYQRDLWTEGYEMGYAAALAARIDGTIIKKEDNV